jgi:glutamate racemase
VGDTARVPYGTKSPETVTRYSRDIVQFLLKQQVKMIVVACNTASAFALPTLEQEFPVPIVGVIKAGVQGSLHASSTKRLGIIGTEGTIRSGSYEAEIRQREPATQVTSLACPLFVPIVEEGWMETEAAALVAKTYLAPLHDKIDTLILGCTHYPLLKKVIQRVMGPAVMLIDSAEETSNAVVDLLRERRLTKETGPGSEQFFVTDSPERFLKVGKLFMNRLERVTKVAI